MRESISWLYHIPYPGQTRLTGYAVADQPPQAGYAIPGQPAAGYAIPCSTTTSSLCHTLINNNKLVMPYLGEAQQADHAIAKSITRGKLRHAQPINERKVSHCEGLLAKVT